MALWLSWLFCILACLQSIEASVNEDGAKYKVKYTLKKDEVHDVEGEVYSVAGYECIIPPKHDTSDEESLQRDVFLDQYEQEMQKTEAIELIRRFNDHYRGTFVKVEKGLWGYTLSFNNRLLQYYKGEEVTLRYSLFAMVNSAEGSNIDSAPDYHESRFEFSSEGNGLRYVTQKLGNGKVCDLTGLPRTTTMHYICNPEAKKPVLASVDEWRTCDYIARVESDWFCSSSLLNDDLALGKTAWTQSYSLVQTLIECSLAENSLYEGYTLPFDFSGHTLHPLSLGLFLGTPDNVTETDTKVLILSSNYKTKNNKFYDLNDVDLESYLSDLLHEITVGFKRLIDNDKFLDPFSKNAVSKSDSFTYTLPLFYSDGLFIGNILLEKEQEIITTSISNESAFDFTFGNWIFYEHQK